MPFTVHPSVCDIRKDISDPKLIIVVIGDNKRTVQARSGATEARKVTGLLNGMLDIENFRVTILQTMSCFRNRIYNYIISGDNG